MAILDKTYLCGDFSTIVVDEDPTVTMPEDTNPGDLIYYQPSPGSPAIIYGVSAFGAGKILRRNNYNATDKPRSSDDETKGYDKGSEWIYNNKFYKCVNSQAGKAEWLEVEAEGADATVISSEKLMFDKSMVLRGTSTKMDDIWDLVYALQATDLGVGQYVLQYSLKYRDVIDGSLIGFDKYVLAVNVYEQDDNLLLNVRGISNYATCSNGGDNPPAPYTIINDGGAEVRLHLKYGADVRFQYVLEISICDSSEDWS